MNTAGISSWHMTTAFLYAAALVTALLSSPPGACPGRGFGNQNCVSVSRTLSEVRSRAAERGIPTDAVLVSTDERSLLRPAR